LFSAYGGRRPPWNVAGVDYYVGAPAGALLDPTTQVPAGCGYNQSTKTVSCNGSNMTVSGYDFSLNGGIMLNISGANNVVSGNKFAVAPNCVGPLIYFTTSSNSTLKITKNTFDGGGGACSNVPFGTSLYGLYGDGSVVTVQYNYFYRTSASLKLDRRCQTIQYILSSSKLVDFDP
jgi:hypothetical protein